jgi:predicted O-methyltransferase YrrM
MRASDRELGEKLVKASERESKHVSTESKRLFRQLEALAALYTDVKPDISLPPTRGWAASPDLLVYLYGVVRQRRPKLIVECGSGLSTLVIAHALRANQFGRIVALEHAEQFREATREWLIAHDVEGWVDLRHAPLTPVVLDGREWLWYSMDALPEGQIDLLFVDGPPGDTMANARYPAMPLLVDRLSAKALVVLDDAARSEEAEIAERWSELYPQWTMEKLIHEKGTIIFTMNGFETAPSRTTEATPPG